VLVHAVLEGFPAVDKDHGNFVGELAAELVIAVDIHLLPVESPAPMQLIQALLHNFAEMASLARIEDHLAGLRHEASVTENDSAKRAAGLCAEERVAAIGYNPRNVEKAGNDEEGL
jgi:hypothetical protein